VAFGAGMKRILAGESAQRVFSIAMGACCWRLRW
jgi:hypothetical protein